MTGRTHAAAPAIRIEGLSKLYRRVASGHQLRTLKSALVERSLVRGLRRDEAIVALEDISFDVAKGEAVGLIGSNGSGKSTLLKTVAGILRPTGGVLEIDGRVAALIELGAGFHPEISGRENIYINGAVLGLSRREIDHRFDDIVSFSGLERFIDEPVKNYSSGMYVRLGFAVAIHTDPDVLLVDEVLAVGDEAFAHRCLRRIDEFLARGKTLLLVSHSLTLIEEVCDRAIWIDDGHLRLDGHPRRVIDAYRESVAAAEAAEHRSAKEKREQGDGEGPSPAGRGDEETRDSDKEDDDKGAEVLRWGSQEAVIERVRILVGDEERYHLECGDPVTFEITVRARQTLDDFVFGIAINTPREVECWGTNTDLAGFVPKSLGTGVSTVRVTCPDLRLAPGEYLVDMAVHSCDGAPYDYRRKLLGFSVTSGERGVGIYFPNHRWEFEGEVEWDRDDEDQSTSP